MKKFISKDDINYLKRTLKNCNYLLIKHKNLLLEAEGLAIQIDEEMAGKGIAYDAIPGTTSVAVTPYINELQVRQYTYEYDAKKYKKEFNELMERNKINERLQAINEADANIIYMYYFECLSLDTIADIRKIKKQTVSEKLDRAIVKMLEVEV